MTIKTPQFNDPVEQVHQVIYNMIVTKDLDKTVLEYIYIGKYPNIYSMGDKGILSLHYK